MCGRYAFYMPPEKLKSFFGLENLINAPARYNCAPMQDMPIVIKNRAGFARWGFRPEWSKHDDTTMASKMINARSESVDTKPSFRDAWARGRRCLIPANGFYEWHTDTENVKRAYYIQHKSEDILCMGGLWSKVEEQITFTVLTKPANGAIADLHHRMPVLIGKADVQRWFGGEVKDAHDMISNAQGEQCVAHCVASDVGKVANDHAGLILPFSDRHIEERDSQSSLEL